MQEYLRVIGIEVEGLAIVIGGLIAVSGSLANQPKEQQ